MIIYWVVDPLCGSLLRLLSESVGPMEAACRVASSSVLCWAFRSSQGDSLTSIGLLVGLCISDSLKTTFEL